MNYASLALCAIYNKTFSITLEDNKILNLNCELLKIRNTRNASVSMLHILYHNLSPKKCKKLFYVFVRNNNTRIYWGKKYFSLIMIMTLRITIIHGYLRTGILLSLLFIVYVCYVVYKRWVINVLLNGSYKIVFDFFFAIK